MIPKNNNPANDIQNANITIENKQKIVTLKDEK